MPPRGKIQARQILTRSTSSKNSICSKISVCKIVPGKNIPIWTLFRGIHPHQKVTPNESLMMRWWISGCLVPHDSSHNRSQNVQHLRLSRGLLGWSLWHDFGSHLHCLNTLSRLEWNDVSPGLAGHEPCRLIWKIWKVRITGVSAWLYKVCSREFQVWLDFTWLYFYVFFLRIPSIIYSDYTSKMPQCILHNSEILGLNPCITWALPRISSLLHGPEHKRFSLRAALAAG